MEMRSRRSPHVFTILFSSFRFLCISRVDDVWTRFLFCFCDGYTPLSLWHGNEGETKDILIPRSFDHERCYECYDRPGRRVGYRDFVLGLVDQYVAQVAHTKAG